MIRKPLYRLEVYIVMEIPDSHRDLLESDVAALATVGLGGRPQLTAVWFLNDNGSLRLSLNTARQKFKNLQLNRSCALLILDLSNPYRYLEIRGDVDISPDDGYLFADRVAEKYHTDYRSVDAPGDRRVVVTVQPRKINAVDVLG